MLVDGRSVYLVTLVLLLGLTVAFLVVVPAPTERIPTPDAGSYETTADGTRYLVHPSSLRVGCPGGTDCIPSIDDPSFERASGAEWLAEEDLVIGVEINGDARAYPLRILNLHEIVNDRVGGQPIAVTYCPLCRSGLVFDRRVNGATVTFGVSGKLLNANLVMYDRETGTLWSQINGTAIVGPLVPTELTIVSSTITTWGQWQSTHPESLVLSRDTDIYPPAAYGSSPYENFGSAGGVGFGVRTVDDRLPPKEIVYGVTIGNHSRAYPEDVVRERNVINDVVGDIPVLIVEDPRDGSISVFVRTVEDDTVRFAIEDGHLVDANGHRWEFEGRASTGPHASTRLPQLNSHGMYWFAWSKFYPDTSLYKANQSTPD